ncbi:DUF4258 domain-containing protein [Thermococcus aciditolerans]|uniref:DUF4258 domain-containing protein n=1 Tax=Thermococcus aciditolerans TaxID=2598455 RepID=A0A5C0SL17_9EURY|nr:DUF4258 domain-containing protein [Thermococcus aciditolerans]QEK14980.1 DUF4258 domain-containing protein [Thermococcus aciditolerans]
MEIRFIPHALERLEERGIPRELVEEVLLNPEGVSEGYFGRKVAQKRLNGKLIRVIYEETSDGMVVVITAYITSKVRKYGGGEK